MIAIILAGGRGSRIGQKREKPLLEIKGIKMIDLVANAAKESMAEEFFVAVSPNTPKTKKYCEEKAYNIIETGGKGYHGDIVSLLESYSVFVSLPSDTPFLSSRIINDLIRAYNGMSITGCVPVDRIPSGVTPGYSFDYDGTWCAAVGVNIVTHSESSRILVFDDPLLGINVNTLDELEIAREYLVRSTKKIGI